MNDEENERKILTELDKESRKNTEKLVSVAKLSKTLGLSKKLIVYHLKRIQGYISEPIPYSPTFENGVKINQSGIRFLKREAYLERTRRAVEARIKKREQAEKLKEEAKPEQEAEKPDEEGKESVSSLSSGINQKFFDLVLSILLGISLTQFLSFFLRQDISIIWGFIFSFVIIGFYLSIVYYLLITQKGEKEETKRAFFIKVCLAILIIFWPYATQKIWESGLGSFFVGIYVIFLSVVFTIWRYIDSGKFDSSIVIGIFFIVLSVLFTLGLIVPLPIPQKVGGL